MTITRGDQVIELTPGELVQAYFEQQELFDIDDILELSQGVSDRTFINEFGITVAEFRQLAPRIAKHYRELMSYDDFWQEARYDAARGVIEKLRKEAD